MIARDHRILVVIAFLLAVLIPIAIAVGVFHSSAPFLQECDFYFSVSLAGWSVLALFLLAIVTLFWIWWKPKS